jgi:hypothetical protein
VAPPRGEGLGVCTILGGEERDDLTEDLVGEVADAVNDAVSSLGPKLHFLTM